MSPHSHDAVDDSYGSTAVEPPLAVDYLVGGLRISLDGHTTTPGPRSHILHFTQALTRAGHNVKIYLANEAPGLGRFKHVSEGFTRDKTRFSLALSDMLRIIAALWAGIWILIRSRASTLPRVVIYERIAVFQSLSSFHRGKRQAVRVVESNGLMAKETAKDRNGIYFERLASALERRTYRRADLIVAVSRNLADEIVEFAQVPRKKILVVPNAIPPALIQVHRRESSKFIVGFSGSVVPWQQLELLIEAFSQAVQADEEFARQATLEIIGDGPAKQGLVRQVQQKGLDSQVRLIARMPQSELFACMATWHVGFAGHEKTSSSVMYHSPLKMYEYAGLGLSAISTETDDAVALEKAGMLVYFFENESELRDSLLRSFRERADVSKLCSRENVYAKHSWDNRVGTVMSAVASIITENHEY